MTSRALTPTTSHLPVQVRPASDQLIIAARLTDEILRQRWVDFLKRLSADASIRILSGGQALDTELLGKYEEVWDWGSLSESENLPWSSDLISRFIDRWEWGIEFNIENYSSQSLPPDYVGRGLSGNVSLPWSADFIEQFSGYLSPKLVSSNTGLPWSVHLLDRYEGQWDWEQLSANLSLPWAVELLDRFKDKWDWQPTSYIGYLVSAIKSAPVFPPGLRPDFLLVMQRPGEPYEPSDPS